VALLFADENVSLRVVRVLRDLGHDVLTTHEAGLSGVGTADLEILQAAISAGRAVLTQDRYDFMRLHARLVNHAGIVVCTYDPDAERLATRINDAIAAHTSLAGLLIRVTRPGPEETQT
jgi:predicted nuclease of predicted toxin-antitoxin system